jgi:hypothetical protein
MNITDVGHLTGDRDMGDDKMEKESLKEGKTAWEIADFYTKAFKDDLTKLNIIFPNIFCRATDNIKEQIEMIQKLEEKGFTYKTNLEYIGKAIKGNAEGTDTDSFIYSRGGGLETKTKLTSFNVFMDTPLKQNSSPKISKGKINLVMDNSNQNFNLEQEQIQKSFTASLLIKPSSLVKQQTTTNKYSYGNITTGGVNVSDINYLSVSPALKQEQISRQTIQQLNRSGLISAFASVSNSQFNFNEVNYPKYPVLVLPPISIAGLELPSNITKGGKQPRGYTPSFQAIIFNIKGKVPKGVETGARLRPIPKGFSFFKKFRL